MTIAQLVRIARSYRRFDSSYIITQASLRELIDYARLASSARNGQTLKYKPITDTKMSASIFPALRWAGYLTDWEGPAPHERPAAYIVVLHDKSLGNFSAIDAGLATQNMILGAAEKGWGCCIIGAFDHKQLVDACGIDTSKYDVVHVLAIGRTTETVQIEPMPADGDIRYWRTSDQIHHVPKRAVDEIIV